MATLILQQNNATQKQEAAKEALERETRLLSEYNRHDCPEFPGWTFLVPDVLRSYDLCPFLNINDFKPRKQWLDSQEDHGRLYYEITDRLNDTEKWGNMQARKVQVMTELENYVRTTVNETMQEEHQQYDALLHNVNEYKTSKSKSKRMKDLWDGTLRVFDYLVMTTGIDFSVHLNLVYGVIIKYKTPPTGIQIDEKFTKLCNDLTSIKTEISTEKSYREKQRLSARKKLVELIEAGFRMEQTGKFYKRWSSLTDGQKQDRIHSYCEWKCLKEGYPMETSTKLFAFITEKLASKELKSSDVIWDNSNGIIQDVKIDISTETFDPSLRTKVKPPPKKKSSKKKRENPFAHCAKQEARLNRLLLYHILYKRGQKKEEVIERVLSDFNPSPIMKHRITSHAAMTYDKMVEHIRGRKK